MSAVIDITPRLNLGRIGGSSVLPIMQLYHPKAFGSAPSYQSSFDVWATIDAKRHGLEMKSQQNSDGVYYGEADTKADAWALATMIYEVLGVGLMIREEVRR